MSDEKRESETAEESLERAWAGLEATCLRVRDERNELRAEVEQLKAQLAEAQKAGSRNFERMVQQGLRTDRAEAQLAALREAITEGAGEDLARSVEKLMAEGASPSLVYWRIKAKFDVVRYAALAAPTQHETIVSAAVRKMATGPNHAVCLGHLWEKRPEQGFITSTERFVDRVEALRIATAAGQLIGREKHHPLDKLLSEDLWDGEATTQHVGEEKP